MKNLLRFCLVVVIILTVVILHARHAHAAASCETFRSQFCADVKPGSGRIYSCLKQNEKKLNEDCRKELNGRSDRFEASLSGCDKELSKYCAKVERGQGRVLACLVDHHKDLSRTCRKSLDTFSW